MANTHYVVLRRVEYNDSEVWEQVGGAVAHNGKEAIRKLVKEHMEAGTTGLFLAIPAQSFKARTVGSEAVLNVTVE